MSLSNEKNVIKSFIEEVFNKHNMSAAEKYFAKENPSIGQGSEGFKQSLNALFTAFPDIHAEIEHIIAENDVVVVFLNFTGTHKGEFQGMPPTNKKINIRSADLYKVEDEIIVGHWDVVDQLNLLQQTGVITFTHLNQQ
ncbi:MAG TPA: ester cyclase [Nitrososphaeraceae archaeon]|nr:ester cyclase [Nitrososphaeraceae archaeon]